MKKLLGIFNAKLMTPEQIFEKAQKTLQEIDRLALLELAKKRGKKNK